MVLQQVDPEGPTSGQPPALPITTGQPDEARRIEEHPGRPAHPAEAPHQVCPPDPPFVEPPVEPVRGGAATIQVEAQGGRETAGADPPQVGVELECIHADAAFEGAGGAGSQPEVTVPGHRGVARRPRQAEAPHGHRPQPCRAGRGADAAELPPARPETRHARSIADGDRGAGETEQRVAGDLGGPKTHGLTDLAGGRIIVLAIDGEEQIDVHAAESG